ncbi:tetratricopeptide repeat protein [Aquisediminimonas sediminicola]|uniref:tetratricopeptide repeat protein n=1 Tax=Alteraquisediminimonas sediminicola TaxID=2676787 RepID=UPI001C8EE39F|nr:tetratricopeptide repeat protein [Aquisediminimonas sediminicola]
MSAADREMIEAFKRDVVDPSMTSLVILDFWAEWCGPCKALTPVLEKIAAEYAGKGVLLAKINVDEQKIVAAQFRVQSIPTVYAVFQGQIVADLTQMRSEGQLRQMLDQIIAQLPITGPADAQAEDLAPLIAMGEEVLAAGDVARAEAMFSQLIEMAPDNGAIVAGLVRTRIAQGMMDEAEAVLNAAPASLAKDQGLQQLRASLALARNAVPVQDMSGLEARLAANGDDHEARFELAGGYLAAGNRDAAADALLEIIKRDRAWNEGAARTQLLQLFESVGLEDPWVAAQRRRLSAVLFG